MRTTGAFVLAAVFAGCGAPAPEETPMTMAAARPGAGAPPIDHEAPATLETATFALG
jgi:hypothetical protein